MTDEFTPLTIQDYVSQALTTDQRSDSGSLTFPLLGLFGETGSLLSEVKKKQRDRASYLGYAGAVVEELGDVLWYLTAVAARGAGRGTAQQESAQISGRLDALVISSAILPPGFPRMIKDIITIQKGYGGLRMERPLLNEFSVQLLPECLLTIHRFVESFPCRKPLKPA